VFVGYRNYDKREISVHFPFGFGLAYTSFEEELLDSSLQLDTSKDDGFDVSVRVKNTGNRTGSQVVQIYSSESDSHILRPVKELVGFTKVSLAPGEEKTVAIHVAAEALRYFDPKKHQWVQPIGAHRLFAATSAADIFGSAELTVLGPNPYPLNGDSTISEVLKSKDAVKLINEFTNNMFDHIDPEQLDFMLDMKLNDILSAGMIQIIPDTVQLDKILHGLYEKLSAL
jgi:beta-glucosidase